MAQREGTGKGKREAVTEGKREAMKEGNRKRKREKEEVGHATAGLSPCKGRPVHEGQWHGGA